MPDWYPLLRAARYLGVAPWLLLQQPYAWQAWALTAERVEGEVQEELRKQAEASAQ